MDEPLNVQVARALGCKPRLEYGGSWHCGCKPIDHRAPHPHAGETIHEGHCHSETGLGCEPTLLAAYDTDWSATGPRIEEYAISLDYFGSGPDDQRWYATGQGYQYAVLDANGPTPLIAVCKLIVKLHEGRP